MLFCGYFAWGCVRIVVFLRNGVFLSGPLGVNMKLRKSLTVAWRIVSVLGGKQHRVTDGWWLPVPQFYTNSLG